MKLHRVSESHEFTRAMNYAINWLTIILFRCNEKEIHRQANDCVHIMKSIDEIVVSVSKKTSKRL